MPISGGHAFGNKVASNITGRVEQAVLIVQDSSQKLAGNVSSGRFSHSPDTIKRLRKNSAFQAIYNDDVGEWAGDMLNVGDMKELFIPVQFNPSELMINSSTQTMTDLASMGAADAEGGDEGEAKAAPKAAPEEDKTKRVSDVTGNGSVVKEEPFPTNSLTVSLYFDDMRPSEAFIMDKLAMANPIDLAKVGINAIADHGKRPAHSVQTVVEGLLALLQVKGAQRVTFRWNEFSFRGVVTTVQANYTMFNSVGAPVRATVLLRIQEELDKAEYDKRCRAFNDYFTGAGGSLRRSQDTVGALFNLNL